MLAKYSVHSATPDGLTTVPPDQFLTAKKNVAVCFMCTNHGTPSLDDCAYFPVPRDLIT